jgi:hypothetical protein
MWWRLTLGLVGYAIAAPVVVPWRIARNRGTLLEWPFGAVALAAWLIAFDRLGVPEAILLGVIALAFAVGLVWPRRSDEGDYAYP